MDPLYANLDKRNSSADQPKPQAPQPTAYSMPNFGQPGTSSVTPTGPIVSSPEPTESIKPIISTEPAKPITPAEPITPAPTEPTTPKPVVSGSGDIILNIDQPKKSKKGLSIGLAIVCLLFVGGFITFLMLNKSNNVNIVERTFNNYANYLLYGTESAEEIQGEYEYGSQYYAAEIYDEYELEEYVKNSKTKYESLYNAIQNIDGNKNPNKEKIINLLDAYGEKLDLFLNVRARPNLTKSNILTATIDAEDDVENKIEEYYENFVISNVQTTVDYGKEYIERSKGLVSIYKILKANNCIDEESYIIISNCNKDSTINDSIKTFEDFRQTANTKYSDATISTFSNIWTIKEAINE